MPNFVSVARPVAKLARGAKSRTQSLTHQLTQLIWFPGKRSFRFGTRLQLKNYLKLLTGEYRLKTLMSEVPLLALMQVSDVNGIHRLNCWQWQHLPRYFNRHGCCCCYAYQSVINNTHSYSVWRKNLDMKSCRSPPGCSRVMMRYGCRLSSAVDVIPLIRGSLGGDEIIFCRFIRERCDLDDVIKWKFWPTVTISH